ncbi:hypothetical protein BH23PSE2_BH23PSE2_02370 [soil metagenome]
MTDAGIYRFADVEVDPAAHRVTRHGLDVPLEPKAFALLLVMLEQAGKALERDELLDRVWGHRHVTPGVLNRVVAQLRKALGDDAEHPRYIQTLHSLGYRFIAELHDPESAEEAGTAGADVPEATAAMEGDGTLSPAQGSSSPAVPEAEMPGLPQQRRASDATATTPVDPASGPALPERRRAGRPHARPWTLATLLLLAGAAWWAFERGEVAPGPVEASVAVLPFASLSDDPADRYFAEGLAVEMHDALAGVPGLKVAAQPAAAAG